MRPYIAKMKGQKSILLFILAIVSLLGIGGILLTGILKSKPKEVKNTNDQKVLGEEISSKLTPTSAIDVNKFVQDTFQNTKEVAGQKMVEVQKTILNTVEKEVSSLAQSQVDALKHQICRDWGVIKSSPSPSP